MALSVDINANTRQAQSQVKDLSKELDKYADSLDDMARDADQAGEKVERSFREMQRAAEKLDDSVSDVRDSGGRSLHALGETGEEVSGELKQNLGETFSSFRGDLEDIPQIAQDVLGGLAGSVSGLGGAFALAGGAAGVGLLINAFTELQKKEEEHQQRIADWTSAYIDGLSQQRDALASFASIEAIYTDPEKYKKAETNAKNWGTTIETAVAAMAGDKTALIVVNDNLTKSEEEAAKGAVKFADGGEALADQLVGASAAARDGRTAYNELTGEMAEGAARAQQYSDTLLGVVRGASSAAKEVDELGNTVYELPDGQRIMIDAETGKATADLSKFKGDADGVINHLNGRNITLDVDASLTEALRKVNQFITSSNGKSFTLRGRVKVDSGGSWD
ncbi:hypothetical protein ACTJJ4_03070 [Microbacterium sp. 22195]|uniref:hypothetical protein n=1 Tax=Microbacterium sp. 22195 TaxID=3453891 RepID=UPI003F82ABAE